MASTLVIRHDSHTFARTGAQNLGICGACSCDPDSYLATKRCAGVGRDPLPPRLAAPEAVVCCTVCDEPAAERYEVQIRDGGPVEIMCRSCIAWLRDSLNDALGVAA